MINADAAFAMFPLDTLRNTTEGTHETDAETSNTTMTSAVLVINSPFHAELINAMSITNDPTMLDLSISHIDAETISAMPNTRTFMYFGVFIRVPEPLHISVLATATDAAGTNRMFAFSRSATQLGRLAHPLPRAPANGAGSSLLAPVPPSTAFAGCSTAGQADDCAAPLPTVPLGYASLPLLPSFHRLYASSMSWSPVPAPQSL